MGFPTVPVEVTVSVTVPMNITPSITIPLVVDIQ